MHVGKLDSTGKSPFPASPRSPASETDDIDELADTIDLQDSSSFRPIGLEQWNVPGRDPEETKNIL